MAAPGDPAARGLGRQQQRPRRGAVRGADLELHPDGAPRRPAPTPQPPRVDAPRDRRDLRAGNDRVRPLLRPGRPTALRDVGARVRSVDVGARGRAARDLHAAPVPRRTPALSSLALARPADHRHAGDLLGGDPVLHRPDPGRGARPHRQPLLDPRRRSDGERPAVRVPADPRLHRRVGGEPGRPVPPGGWRRAPAGQVARLRGWHRRRAVSVRDVRVARIHERRDAARLAGRAPDLHRLHVRADPDRDRRRRAALPPLGHRHRDLEDRRGRPPGRLHHGRLRRAWWSASGRYSATRAIPRSRSPRRPSSRCCSGRSESACATSPTGSCTGSARPRTR